MTAAERFDPAAGRASDAAGRAEDRGLLVAWRLPAAFAFLSFSDLFLVFRGWVSEYLAQVGELRTAQLPTRPVELGKSGVYEHYLNSKY